MEDQTRKPMSFGYHGIPESSQFVPRDAEMRRLEQLLLPTDNATSRRKVGVIHGLGGIGKTQLAIAFAQKTQSNYDGVFWLDGSSEQRLKESFVNVAQRLPQDESTASVKETLEGLKLDIDRLVQELLDWLSLPQSNRWLMIIDGMDRDRYDKTDPQAYNIEKYFPRADHGYILITTRLSRLLATCERLRIEPVEMEQARAILEKNAGKVVDGAESILELLGGLPLALAQAGSYIRETDMSAASYTKHYNTAWSSLMEKQNQYALYGDQASVLTTWTVTYKHVKRQSEDAASLLRVWAFLDHRELWHGLIAAAIEFKKCPEWLLKLAKEELEFDHAMSLLCRYSLVEEISNSGAYRVHPVLHKWCGQQMEGQERQSFRNIAAGLIAEKVRNRTHVDYWPTNKRLLPHGMAVRKWIDGQDLDITGKDTELLSLPVILRELATLLSCDEFERAGATNLYRRALKLSERNSGSKDSKTLEKRVLLADHLTWIGEYDEAEDHYNRAIKCYEADLGPDHEVTVAAVDNLGRLCQKMGKYEESKTIHLRTFKTRHNLHGPENRLTRESAANLGIVYCATGQYQKAEKLIDRALDDIKKAKGPKHPRTIALMRELALVYLRLENYEESEKVYQRALDASEEVYGPEDSETLKVLHELGRLYEAKGDKERAEELYRRVLKGFEAKAALKDTNIYDTAWDCMWDLGCLLIQTKRCPEEAKRLTSEALSFWENKLWVDDTRCVAMRGKLARLEKGEDDANALSENTSKDYEKATFQNHKTDRKDEKAGLQDSSLEHGDRMEDDAPPPYQEQEVSNQGSSASGESQPQSSSRTSKLWDRFSWRHQ